MTAVNDNIATINRELIWFSGVLDNRIENYLQNKTQEDPAPPDLTNNNSAYAELVSSLSLDTGARRVLMLAMAPHIGPSVLDPLFTKNKLYDRGMTEFGGYVSKYHGGFLPTGETAVFVNSLGNFEKRKEAYRYLDPDSPLLAEGILSLEDAGDNAPRMSAPLTVAPKYLEQLTGQNTFVSTSFSSFPARKITTALEWSDLVLDKHAREDIDQILKWIKHGDTLINELGLAKKIKPGYKSLFHGPPGTGKTLTACLLGKATEHEVYRVDLSVIVSKYIGETEKNLARVFDYAEKQKWILFFDEADALFGKRTQTSSANDRFANQEVAYLLQRIEEFPGVIILASNLRSNIDAAFSRRFQSMVYFAMPNVQQRHQLWQKIFEGPLQPEDQLDLLQLAKDYEMSGGSAINVYRFGALKAMSRDERTIRKEDVLKGIQKEFSKEGKTL